MKIDTVIAVTNFTVTQTILQCKYCHLWSNDKTGFFYNQTEGCKGYAVFRKCGNKNTITAHAICFIYWGQNLCWEDWWETGAQRQVSILIKIFIMRLGFDIKGD